MPAKDDDVGSSTVSTANSGGEGGGATAAVRRRPDSSLSSRFKGVVLQQNGHWGAQIYARHTRIWLGTFRSELAAAAAYDSAAAKLHRVGDISGSGGGGGHCHRNLPPTELSAHEPAFQDLFTTEAVLAMIRDGSYESRFAEFLRVAARGPPAAASSSGRGTTYRELFKKELTPSDVGKLNRLVVPKRHAVQHFPAVPAESEELLIEFRDAEGRPWVFRYCYWKSSQSYVFTKGWNKFVREKELRARDVVTFYRCEEEREGLRRTYTVVDVARGRRGDDGGDHHHHRDPMVDLELGIGRGDVEDDGDHDEEEGEEEAEEEKGEEEEEREETKEVRLFGVCIS